MENWQQWFYDPCLASAAMKYTTLTKYYVGGVNRDDNRNEDRNENDNDASGLGSNGPIFGLITTP